MINSLKSLLMSLSMVEKKRMISWQIEMMLLQSETDLIHINGLNLQKPTIIQLCDKGV